MRAALVLALSLALTAAAAATKPAPHHRATTGTFRPFQGMHTSSHRGGLDAYPRAPRPAGGFSTYGRRPRAGSRETSGT